jgi:uncharacterized membrane protein YfcA
MSEVLVSFLLLVPLFLLLNPFHQFMFSQVQMMAIALLVVFFAVFSVFIFREKASDEREILLRFVAGRFAYLAGGSILVVSIVLETLDHALDMWLVISLAVMVLAKIIGLLYARSKH